ncbi:MAG: signal peptide peptidase SppA [Pseudomonadota bacterium]
MASEPAEGAPSEAIALEYVLEKRRLRRSRFWWRLIAIVVFLILVGVSFMGGEDGPGRDHIARFDVEGVIADDPKRDALLRSLRDDDRVKAVIVRINSPGGSTVGGEALYAELRRLSEAKPMIAVMGEVAASAGYITALAADHIVARGNTITASIGVIFMSANFSETLDAAGVQVIELKSGERKAQPSPFTPVDEANLDVERALIAESYDWFVGLVEERRNIDPSTRRLIRDGRILSGRQALAAGLVDQIGGQPDAVDWLVTEQNIDPDLPVLVREVEEEREGVFTRLIEGAAASLGWPFALDGSGLWAGPRLMSTLR